MTEISTPLSTENRCRKGDDLLVQHRANRGERPAKENPQRFSTLPLLPLQALTRRRLPGVHRCVTLVSVTKHFFWCSKWGHKFISLYLFFFVVFIYSMPGYACSIKERMLYSSCKNNLIDMVESKIQIEIEKKVSTNNYEQVWLAAPPQLIWLSKSY